jgi:tripeptide aminopeptidase
MTKQLAAIRRTKPAGEAARAGARTSGNLEPELDRADKILLEMLAIAGGSGREEQVAQYIIGQLRRAGVPPGAIVRDQAHRRSPHGGDSGNLVFRLPGTIAAGRRMLSAHMDTVPLCVGARPVVRRGFVVPVEKTTALGGDDRAGAAAILVAALEILARRRPHPPLVFLWTVQEELGLYGARFASLGLLGRPGLAFNFDGGAPEQVTIGATGGYRMQIRVRGLASHAGVAPEKGVSAITIASLAIAELHREGWHGLVARDGGCGTCNVGVIRGGDATNVVTPEVEVHAEARSHAPAFRRRIVRAIQRAFQEAARSVRNVDGARGSVVIRGRLDYEAFRLADNDPSLAAAEAAVRAAGGEPVRAISNGGLDANWLTARGVPSVTLGTGVANAHTTDERLDLRQFHQACRIALCLATG